MATTKRADGSGHGNVAPGAHVPPTFASAAGRLWQRGNIPCSSRGILPCLNRCMLVTAVEAVTTMQAPACVVVYCIPHCSRWPSGKQESQPAQQCRRCFGAQLRSCARTAALARQKARGTKSRRRLLGFQSIAFRAGIALPNSSALGFAALETFFTPASLWRSWSRQTPRLPSYVHGTPG